MPVIGLTPKQLTRLPTSSVPVDIANYVCLWATTVQASNSCCAHSLMIYTTSIKTTKLRKLYGIFGVNRFRWNFLFVVEFRHVYRYQNERHGYNPHINRASFSFHKSFKASSFEGAEHAIDRLCKLVRKIIKVNSMEKGYQNLIFSRKSFKQNWGGILCSKCKKIKLW